MYSFKNFSISGWIVERFVLDSVSKRSSGGWQLSNIKAILCASPNKYQSTYHRSSNVYSLFRMDINLFLRKDLHENVNLPETLL